MSMRRKPGQEAGCAVCGRPVTARYRPFCSARCADLDLARWLRGDYRIPTDDAPEDPPPHPAPEPGEE